MSDETKGFLCLLGGVGCLRVAFPHDPWRVLFIGLALLLFHLYWELSD